MKDLGIGMIERVNAFVAFISTPLDASFTHFMAYYMKYNKAFKRFDENDITKDIVLTKIIIFISIYKNKSETVI